MAQSKARMTVVEQIYHQCADQSPESFGSSFNVVLKSDEELYKRRIDVGTDWTKVDTGWVKCPTLLRIEHINPSADAQPLILGVEHAGVVVAVSFISPGRSVRIEPISVLYIRCDEPRRAIVQAVPE